MIENTKATATPDYKKLFEETLMHLTIVSGSRNSFAPEVSERLFCGSSPVKELRTKAVEDMHHDAVDYLNNLRRQGFKY